jgi:hypothetical protein
MNVNRINTFILYVASVTTSLSIRYDTTVYSIRILLLAELYCHVVDRMQSTMTMVMLLIPASRTP